MGKDSLLGQLEAKKEMASELKIFEVTITETLSMTVKVRAADRCEAEQMVNDDWRNSNSPDEFLVLRVDLLYAN